VCGAPNARAGIKVALANIGSIIPTNGIEIKKAAVRGVESQGMMCSAR
jgi:phenylalanyl-tRNA synthetase beta chain